MKKRLNILVVLLFFCCVETFSQNVKVDDLGWMAGCWERSLPERQLTIAEQWMKPAGGMMLGMSRTVRAGKTTGFEFVRIVAGELGIDYVARPSTNKEETTFKMVKSSATEIVFENLTHDFPQRIIYKSQTEGLYARIEGTRNGKLNGMDIPMKRVKCE